MIDIENEIFDKCARLVMAKYPDAFVSSVDVLAPASFPAVSIVEADGRTDSAMVDSSAGEYAVVVSYDIVVSTNLRTGAKKQAKDIFAIINDCLVDLNFTRTYVTRGEYQLNASVYQIRARFMVGVTKDGKLYRRQ